MTSAINVEGLVKRFNDFTAVNDISFEMYGDEFFSLVGPSGCGKTTTLRCVAGLETASWGRIDIKGTTVYSATEAASKAVGAKASAAGTLVPTHERSIGMVFQNYAVWPHMTVFENIAYPLRLRGDSRQEQRKEVGRVLEMLGMENLLERKPSQLSGGQQQRVALGRALVARPNVLLLDEPLSNLDAKLREQMRTELKRIQREIGIPILYVTHDQDEALSMSDRIAVMSAGRIHQIATPAEIYEQPSTKFVLDFIGSVNYLDVEIVAVESGRVRLRLNDGQELDLPKPVRMPEGRSVLLAVRPEDITVVRGDSGGSDAGPALRATVDLRSFRGNICEYRMTAGSGTGAYALWVQTEKTHLIPEGEPVGLQVERGYLLDADARDRPDAPVGWPG